MKDFERLMAEEMMRPNREEIANTAKTLWMIYSEFIKAGFTKAQAMQLIKHMLNPVNGGGSIC